MIKSPPFRSVIINSIAKSGTYLLTKLVDALGAYPQMEDYHFNDQHYSKGYDENKAEIIERIPSPEHFKVIPDGHSVPSHLTWSPAVQQALHDQNLGMFFMYRDPRDLAISFMKFVMYSDVYRYENEGHMSYYNFLCSLENDQRRAEHLLSERLFIFCFYENAPWLFSKACIPISFEALLSDVQALEQNKVGKTIKQIMQYMQIEHLPLPPKEIHASVYGKSKTSMLHKHKTSSHKDFFDQGLRDIANRPDILAIRHMYGYSPVKPRSLTTCMRTLLNPFAKNAATIK